MKKTLSSRIKAFFAPKSNSSASSPPDSSALNVKLSDLPKEFQDAFTASQNAPDVPDIPLFVLTGDIEKDVQAISERIQSLQNQVDSCKNLVNGGNLDSASTEYLYQHQTHFEIALDESILIHDGMVPPDGRKLISRYLSKSELELAQRTIEQLCKAYHDYKYNFMALELIKYIHKNNPSQSDNIRKKEQELKVLQNIYNDTFKKLVPIFSSHYEPSKLEPPNPKSIYKLIGNSIMDSSALRSRLHSFTITSQKYEQQLNSLNRDSPRYNDVLQKFLAAHFLVLETQLLFDSVSPDSSKSNSPVILSPENVHRAQSLLDLICEQTILMNQVYSYINSAGSQIESENRKKSFDKDLASLQSNIHTAAGELYRIYHP